MECVGSIVNDQLCRLFSNVFCLSDGSCKQAGAVSVCVTSCWRVYDEGNRWQLFAFFYAVYFGGLGEMFFNKAVETTLLERITGTISMFMFPIVIYFCIFSFMVRPTPLVVSLQLMHLP